MAVQNDNFAGSGSGNTYIDALLWGCGWTGGPITVAFGTGLNFDGYFGYAWEPAETAAFDRAFAMYESVCNLDFELGTVDTADMVLWSVDNDALGAGTLGMFDVPDETFTQTYGYFNWQNESWNYLTPGGDGFNTIIHELGHAVGLAHPHDGGSEGDGTVFPGVSDDGDTGTYGLNQGIWTMMSYITDWTGQPSTTYAYGEAAGPMAFDIAALQYMYGANMGFRAGNDTYTLPKVNAEGTGWSCLWDAGGIDTINAAGSGTGVTIDLRMAPLTGANAGGFVSWQSGIQGGFTIANGATIENATGSTHNDRLTGNSANNRLNGAGGTDTMIGGAGNDTYITNGSDTITEIANGGTDTVQSLVTLTLGTNVERLTLTGTAAINGTGNALGNLIIGNGAANVLNGLTGLDRMTGGAGLDIFVFNTALGASNVDQITDFNVVADTIRLLGSVFTQIGVGGVSGSEFRASVTGNAGDGSDRILYDKDDGRLYFDRDGTGSATKVLFATIDSGLNLTSADFFVV